jgi:hypothetical protein
MATAARIFPPLIGLRGIVAGDAAMPKESIANVRTSLRRLQLAGVGECS